MATAYDAAGGSSRDSVEAEWVYKDAKGQEVFRLIGLESPGGRRTSASSVEPRCRAAHVVPDGWEAGEGDGPLPRYRLDQLPAKGDKAVVFVLGGEMSADVAGVALDLPAVTSAFGAGFAHRRLVAAGGQAGGDPRCGSVLRGTVDLLASAGRVGAAGVTVAARSGEGASF